MYKKLIEKSKRGDIQSFETLIKEYKIYVYNISLLLFENKMEAEDISQEAILKAFENIESFNGKNSIEVWLYKIAFDTCIKYKEKVKSNVSTNSTADSLETKDIGYENEKLENVLAKEIDSEILKNSIYKLKDEDKIIIYFKDVLDLNYSEIKHILQCDRDIIKSKISQARTSLNDLVNKGILKC
jgi:RNA polymerase sigma-70 factor (ECF subfamily)